MLKRSHYQALVRAVAMADQWRGSLTGNPRTSALERFDTDSRLRHEALRQLLIAMGEPGQR